MQKGWHGPQRAGEMLYMHKLYMLFSETEVGIADRFWAHVWAPLRDYHFDTYACLDSSVERLWAKVSEMMLRGAAPLANDAQSFPRSAQDSAPREP